MALRLLPNETQLAAEEYVARLARKEGIRVEPMQGRRQGYDFTFHLTDGRSLKVEVKGSDRKNPGIPDMRTSEFEKKVLKADYLILVWPARKAKKNLYIIPRTAIKPRNLERLQTFRLRGFGKARLPEFIRTSLGLQDGTKQ